MTQVYDAAKPTAGLTTFGQLYQIIRDHFAAVISRFSGTSFPANPVAGQICWRTDRGTYGYAYAYTGNTSVGESGWVEDALLNSLGVELIAARGSAATLDARLDVALNEDGTLKASTTLNPSQWQTMTGHTFTYSNTTTFVVNGDQTAIYYPRRRVKASLTAGAVYSEVVSATYGAPNTTVVIADAVLDNTLSTVDHSLFAPTANGGAMSIEMLGSSRCPIATAAGTADAITATFVPAIALVDKQLCIIEATAANATTTPTFAPNGLAAKTIVKQGGVALAVGDIPGEHAICILEYNLSHTRWELLNPATTTPLASSAEEIAGASTAKASTPGVAITESFRNYSFTATVSGNALTIADKGENGSDPSATNIVKIKMISSTLTDSKPVTRTLAAALSGVISSGSTLGATANEIVRIYHGVIDSDGAGTLKKCWARTSTAFNEGGLATTVADGGAGGADSADVLYSDAVYTDKPAKVMGFIEVQTGATPGEWSHDPIKLVVMLPGIKRTGEIIQIKNAIFTGTQDIGNSSAWTAVTSLALSMTLSSVCNKSLLRSVVHMGGGAANCAQTRFCTGGSPITALMPTSPGNRSPGQGSAFPAGAGSIVNIKAEVLHAPASVTAQAYTVEAMYVTNNGYINRTGSDTDNSGFQRSVSSFTAMEISA